MVVFVSISVLFDVSVFIVCGEFVCCVFVCVYVCMCFFYVCISDDVIM